MKMVWRLVKSEGPGQLNRTDDNRYHALSDEYRGKSVQHGFH